MTNITLDSLHELLDSLALQVKKNSKAIAETGQHVLSLQIKDQQKKLSQLSIKEPSKSQDQDSSDEDEPPSGAVSSEDIVDLVNELQGQLDILDDRSIKRNVNAFVTEDENLIAPLSNRDGKSPTEEEGFPQTYSQFNSLKPSEVEFWLRYYELLPPDESELEEIMNLTGATLQELGGNIEARDSSKEQQDKDFDSLARFLGLRVRRTKGAW